MPDVSKRNLHPISPWQEFIAQASELQILQKKNDALLASPYKAYFYQPQNIPILCALPKSHQMSKRCYMCIIFKHSGAFEGLALLVLEMHDRISLPVSIEHTDFSNSKRFHTNEIHLMNPNMTLRECIDIISNHFNVLLEFLFGHGLLSFIFLYVHYSIYLGPQDDYNRSI